jgi:hypothetical protein
VGHVETHSVLEYKETQITALQLLLQIKVLTGVKKLKNHLSGTPDAFKHRNNETGGVILSSANIDISALSVSAADLEKGTGDKKVPIGNPDI